MADTKVSVISPGPEEAPPRRRSPLVWVGVAAVAFAAAVVLILVLTRGGDSRPTTNADGQKVTALSPQLAELVALLEQGERETFHAQYRATAALGSPEAAEVLIELWRSPPRLRQDVTVSAGGQSATSASFLLPDRSVGCTREGTATAWTCTNIPSDQSAAPDTLAQQITSEIQAGPIVVSARRVAGLEVQCYELPVSQATAEVCVTRDGIPALVVSGASRIELVGLTREFSQDVFTPPVGEV